MTSMVRTRAAAFEPASKGARARALWALADAERAVRWAARHAAAPDSLLPGLREQWRRLTQRGPQSRAAAKLDAAGLILMLPALPWRFRRQRPQQMARALAEIGRRVLYVDVSVRTAVVPPPRVAFHDGVDVLSLGVPGRPDPYATELTPAQATYLAQRIAGGLRRSPDCILLQLPFWGPLGVALAAELHAPLVYDRIDRHAEFPDAPPGLHDRDLRLASQAHHLVASSAGLCEPVFDGRTWHVIPNGVVLEDFPPREFRRTQGTTTVAGYVGALGAWFDAPVIERAARQLPHWTFLLAGRVEDEQVRALGRVRNVKLLGEIPYSRVPAFLKRLDVALVPFRDTDLTRAVDAVKLYEYLAAGLPVVARELPGLTRWGPPAVYHYGSRGGFTETIRLANDADTPAHAAYRRNLLVAETWRARAEDLLVAVGQA